jgi:hypothetical protein
MNGNFVYSKISDSVRRYTHSTTGVYIDQFNTLAVIHTQEGKPLDVLNLTRSSWKDVHQRAMELANEGI